MLNMLQEMKDPIQHSHREGMNESQGNGKVWVGELKTGQVELMSTNLSNASMSTQTLHISQCILEKVGFNCMLKFGRRVIDSFTDV